ncbi:MAG: molybdopterin-guanine dinucleotide biosynthesis protein B [Candidatus Thorarchaeota archaeon]
MSRFRVFGVSGYSASGKTTVVEALVNALIRRGHIVATVKSSREDISPDDSTDTGRHWRAGADSTVFLGPNCTSITHRRKLEIHDALLGVRADLVLIEGMKESDMPRFWCVTDTREIAVEESNRSGIRAFISRSEPSTSSSPGGRPILTLDDIEELVAIVERDAVDVDLLGT